MGLQSARTTKNDLKIALRYTLRLSRLKKFKVFLAPIEGGTSKSKLRCFLGQTSSFISAPPMTIILPSSAPPRTEMTK